MKVFPLKTITIEDAKQSQFKLIEAVTQEFQGRDILNLGDLGVVQPYNQPVMTKKIELVLANFFECEAALLVRGAGTGALRYSLYVAARENKNILVHDAPIYPTTDVTLKMIGANVIKCNFNDLSDIEAKIKEYNFGSVLVQYTRQKPDDSYNYDEICKIFNEKTDAIVVTDDNYAAMKVKKLAASYCNGLSTFSSFKLQGPEGVGVILGNKDLINQIKKLNYSGGSQVQGFESHEVLRGLINAPVSLAIQSEVVDEVVEIINEINLKHVDYAFVANAQSKVIVIKFNTPIAKSVLVETEKMGACPNPVGAESKYEFVPMFYKISGTFIQFNPENEEYMIRINPMRSGVNTIIKILQQGIDNVSN